MTCGGGTVMTEPVAVAKETEPKERASARMPIATWAPNCFLMWDPAAFNSAQTNRFAEQQKGEETTLSNCFSLVKSRKARREPGLSIAVTEASIIRRTWRP